jgi:antitoxin component YwqK of YwqJK toxin-antitoxin module
MCYKEDFMRISLRLLFLLLLFIGSVWVAPACYAASRVEVSEVNGIPEGPYALYAPSGKVEIKGEFKNGKMDGKWTFWDYDRTKIVELQYKDGLRHGKCYMWYGAIYKKGRFRGNIKQVMEFEGGLAHGEKRIYYTSGALRSIEFLDSGQTVEAKSWNKQGERFSEKEALAMSRSLLKADLEYLSKLESYVNESLSKSPR